MCWANEKLLCLNQGFPISHPSTNQAPPCLASEVRWDRACSGWYGRRPGFPNLDTMDFWGWISLCCGVCPVPSKTFCSIPELYPLDARSIPLPPEVMTTKCQMAPRWEQWVSTHVHLCYHFFFLYCNFTFGTWNFPIVHSPYREFRGKKTHKGERKKAKTVHNSQD